MVSYCVSMSILDPLMAVVVCLRRCRGAFVKIFVLSGWSCRPCGVASSCKSFSICVTCLREGASNSTSSANRRFVSCVSGVWPSLMP